MITTRAPDGANKLRIVRLKAFHYHSPPSVHLSLASQGWLRRFLSVSSSPSSTLPKPPTAKETNAQVIFLSRIQPPTETMVYQNKLQLLHTIHKYTCMGIIFVYLCIFVFDTAFQSRSDYHRRIWNCNKHRYLSS